MTSFALRLPARDLLQAWLARRCRSLSDDDLRQPTLVVAPHPDDETLGCGGTIARRRALGGQVHVVAMTDGGRSHAGLMAAETLSAIRRRELSSAIEALGVDSQASWLGFSDGALAEAREAATVALTRLVVERAPRHLIVPLPNGEHPDHIAAHDIAFEAARRSGLDLVVFEYPVWFWRRWPWVPLEARTPRQAVRGAARAALGLRVLGTFDAAVDVRATLEAKRQALAAHESQTTRLLPVPEWFTLDGVCEGEFLPLFFRDTEIFRRSVIAPSRARASRG
ncbi:MAG TPA: PIG-L deacetylase family protein [Polyangia bacterium]|nr:PIG-L deacetylase family protein [Polyangia bacterium]